MRSNSHQVPAAAGLLPASVQQQQQQQSRSSSQGSQQRSSGHLPESLLAASVRVLPLLLHKRLLRLMVMDKRSRMWTSHCRRAAASVPLIASALLLHLLFLLPTQQLRQQPCSRSGRSSRKWSSSPRQAAASAPAASVPATSQGGQASGSKGLQRWPARRRPSASSPPGLLQQQLQLAPQPLCCRAAWRWS